MRELNTSVWGHEDPQPGDLQVWWIPQVPMRAFWYPVNTAEEGKRLLDALARYDLFCLEERVRPDYSNAGGLVVFEYGEWVDADMDEDTDVDSIPASDSETTER